MPEPAVHIEGLNELRRALKLVADDLPKELREELKNSSAMYRLVGTAKQLLTDSIGRDLARPSRSTGRAAGSIRVTSNSKAVFVNGGKASVPYFGWLDFGGELKPAGGRKNRQSRPFLKRGRALYPAIDQHKDGLRESALEAVANLERKAGL